MSTDCENKKIKKCNKCKEIKSFSCFYIRRDRRDSVISRCKECIKKEKKEYRIKNKKKITESMKKYYEKNKLKIKKVKKIYEFKNRDKAAIYRKKYYLKNKNEILKKSRERNKKYYIKNRKKVLKRNKLYNDKNKSEKKEYYKAYNLKNKCKRLKYSIEYRKKNKDRINKYQEKYIKFNPKNLIKKKISSRINECLKRRCSGKKGRTTWSNILNYTPDELKSYLESKFENGMSWDSYGSGKGKWCIDHVVPDSHFKYSSVDCDGFKKSWALENLQPMWFNENCSKNNRYSGKYISYTEIKPNKTEINDYEIEEKVHNVEALLREQKAISNQARSYGYGKKGEK